MRKLFVSNMISIDGYYAGPNDEIDWHNVDAEFNEMAAEMLDSVDTLVFGRVTYDLMASYWPTPAGIADDPTIASKMNALGKVVFSRTLSAVDWNGARLAQSALADEIARLKAEPGKDMVIFGSGTIVTQLTQLGLIDEFRLYVSPVILGAGKSLFAGVTGRPPLRLVSARAFDSGNAMLVYVTK
ncbi:MAG: dihydrofolate reductase [Chloroflexota bacterium]|nr:dihydrofolate reductase [Chloroflexota bacterium]